MAIPMMLNAAGAGGAALPTPIYVEKAETQITSGTVVTVAKPTGTVEGDIMVAFCDDNSAGKSWTGPAGWTEQEDTNGRAVYTKQAGAGEASSYDFTQSASAAAFACILTFRFCQFDAIGAISGSASPAVAPSVTATVNNCLLVVFTGNSGTTGVTFTPPAGFTSRVADSDANSPSCGAFTKDALVASGATGTTSITVSAGSSRAIQLTLKPY